MTKMVVVAAAAGRLSKIRPQLLEQVAENRRVVCSPGPRPAPSPVSCSSSCPSSCPSAGSQTAFHFSTGLHRSTASCSSSSSGAESADPRAARRYPASFPCVPNPAGSLWPAVAAAAAEPSPELPLVDVVFVVENCTGVPLHVELSYDDACGIPRVAEFDLIRSGSGVRSDPDASRRDLSSIQSVSAGSAAAVSETTLSCCIVHRKFLIIKLLRAQRLTGMRSVQGWQIVHVGLSNLEPLLLSRAEGALSASPVVVGVKVFHYQLPNDPLEHGHAMLLSKCAEMAHPAALPSVAGESDVSGICVYSRRHCGALCDQCRSIDSLADDATAVSLRSQPTRQHSTTPQAMFPLLSDRRLQQQQCGPDAIGERSSSSSKNDNNDNIVRGRNGAMGGAGSGSSSVDCAVEGGSFGVMFSSPCAGGRSCLCKWVEDVPRALWKLAHAAAAIYASHKPAAFPSAASTGSANGNCA